MDVHESVYTVLRKYPVPGCGWLGFTLFPLYFSIFFTDASLLSKAVFTNFVTAALTSRIGGLTA